MVWSLPSFSNAKTTNTVMLAIFTRTYNPRGVVAVAPTAEWLKIRYRENVKRMQSMWQENNHPVLSAHPLVQALKHTGPIDQSPVELSDLAIARAPYLSKNFQFTTDFNKGSFKALKIYPQEDAMIYSSSDYISPYRAVSEWRTLKPLKCLWLDSSNTEFSIPKPSKDIEGFSSVSIDIPQMALMYKGFKQDLVSLQSDSVLGAEDFVGTYVLPSILESQVDLSMISAVMAVYYGHHTPRNRVDYGRFLPTYDVDFVKVAKHFLNRVSDTRFPYVQVLQNIPTAFSTSGLEALQLPDFPSTLQVNWAMLSTRIKVINFLLDVGGVTGRRANQGFINQLKRYTREIRSSQIPFDRMSSQMADLLENSLSRYTKL